MGKTLKHPMQQCNSDSIFGDSALNYTFREVVNLSEEKKIVLSTRSFYFHGKEDCLVFFKFLRICCGIFDTDFEIYEQQHLTSSNVHVKKRRMRKKKKHFIDFDK